MPIRVLIVVAFSFTGAYAIVLYVLGGLVLIGTFVSQQYSAFGWLSERLFDGERDKHDLPPVAPRLADPRIVALTPTGGSSGQVDFRTEVANYGTQRCRCMVSATVGDVAVQCVPQTLDLIPSDPTQSIRILVPRPQLGDLVPEFNSDTTLYGERLRVSVIVDGTDAASEEWREHVYTAEENNARHVIQQRKWRLAKGGADPADLRAEYLAELDQRAGERFADPPPQYET